MKGTARARIRRTHRARRLWVSGRILGDGVGDLVEEVEDDLDLVSLKPEARERIESRPSAAPSAGRDPHGSG